MEGLQITSEKLNYIDQHDTSLILGEESFKIYYYTKDKEESYFLFDTSDFSRLVEILPDLPLLNP